MAQKSLAMTFLFGPPYDIITWAGQMSIPENTEPLNWQIIWENF